jgi:DNA invertase Pin-like site-specific DNA recombinase
MVAGLQPGDTVVVCRLDRLGRSLRELLILLDEFDKRGIGFKSLADAWCDTRTPHGRLLTSILGSLAEFERSLIAARTAEGRERAKRAGIRFGRRPKLTDHQRKEALARRGNGETLAQIARSYAVSVTMISRLSP